MECIRGLLVCILRGRSLRLRGLGVDGLLGIRGLYRRLGLCIRIMCFVSIMLYKMLLLSLYLKYPSPMIPIWWTIRKNFKIFEIFQSNNYQLQIWTLIFGYQKDRTSSQLIFQDAQSHRNIWLINKVTKEPEIMLSHCGYSTKEESP